MKNLLKKYMLKDYKVDDFGRGKSKTAKNRHKKHIKRKANAELEKDYSSTLYTDLKMDMMYGKD